MQILRDVLGSRDEFAHNHKVQESYSAIVEVLRREYGVFSLTERHSGRSNTYLEELHTFILSDKDVDQVLSAIELSFKAIDQFTRKPDYMGNRWASRAADDAINELNGRFKEHGVGYDLVDGEIVRIDSELIHSEAVKPALRLLNQPQYAGAQEEFLRAYEHYRAGNAKETLNECLKAFESLMKAICEKRNWGCATNATAKDLIQTCFDHGLIPPFWQNQYAGLRSVLENGIPTGRNRVSAHGQGVTATEVPNHIVAYMLHLTASSIVFLAEAERLLP